MKKKKKKMATPFTQKVEIICTQVWRRRILKKYAVLRHGFLLRSFHSEREYM